MRTTVLLLLGTLLLMSAAGTQNGFAYMLDGDAYFALAPQKPATPPSP